MKNNKSIPEPATPSPQSQPAHNSLNGQVTLTPLRTYLPARFLPSASCYRGRTGWTALRLGYSPSSNHSLSLPQFHWCYPLLSYDPSSYALRLYYVTDSHTASPSWNEIRTEIWKKGLLMKAGDRLWSELYPWEGWGSALEQAVSVRRLGIGSEVSCVCEKAGGQLWSELCLWEGWRSALERAVSVNLDQLI